MLFCFRIAVTYFLPDKKSPQRRGQKRKLDDNEPFVVVEDEPEVPEDKLALDWFNSDLTLKVSKEDFLTGEPFFKDGWGYVWSGVRATHGFESGKVFFEVKLTEHLESKLENEKQLHEVRVGFSLNDSPLQLGESENSFCYAGSAKKGADSKFEEYGATFTKDDVVGAFLDLSGDEAVISFSKNGESQGEAFRVAKADLGGNALFPHVSARNTRFVVNFGRAVVADEDQEQAFAPIEDDYEFAGRAEGMIRGTPRIATRAE